MGIMDSLHYVFYDCADERTLDLPLTYSIYKVPLMLVLYFYFIVYLGPKFMKNREPWSLKTFMKVYNVFQIFANAMLVYYFLDVGWYNDIWFYCIVPRYTRDPKAMQIVHALWWTMMLKIVDLTETVIYVLRKKNNQLSILHLYHHASTVLLSWMFSRYVAVEVAITIPIINCSIHVIMYTYYLLSSFGPNIQKKIRPYKPLLTIIQMIQFIVLMLHLCRSFLPSCPVLNEFTPIMLVNLMINLLLFYDFYKKNYLTPKQKTK